MIVKQSILTVVLFSILYLYGSGQGKVGLEIAQSSLAGQVLDIYPNFPERSAYLGSSLSIRSRRASLANAAYHNPKTGICLSYGNLGNNAVLGFGLGLQYEIQWVQNTSSGLFFSQSFRPGITYNNRPFDVETNPDNIVVGSHFSALMTLVLGMGYQINDHWSLGVEGSIWHSSNGHTALPNVGMNAILGAFTIVYTGNKTAADAEFTDRQQNKKPAVLTPIIGLSLGVNEAGTTTRPVNAGLYTKRLVSLGIGYRFRKIHRITAAIEGYYDEYYWLLNSTQEWQPPSVRRLNSTALMLMFGHEFIYNRLGLIINGGINVFNPTLGNQVGLIEIATTSNLIKRYVPGRFAIRYYLRHPWKYENNWYVQAGIKSNFGQADFLEFGAGWIISNR